MPARLPKLYASPRGHVFACRVCYELTDEAYKSRAAFKSALRTHAMTISLG
jgi:hypothetical protein